MSEIPVKSKSDVEGMRAAGRVTREILEEVASQAVAGVSTLELNHAAVALLQKHGAKSSFLGYSQPGTPPFPAVICTSLNDEVAHAPPSDRMLCDGDLLKLDFGAVVDGWHGDTAVTLTVGVFPSWPRVMSATALAMFHGIDQMVPDNRLSDVGHAVEKYAVNVGLSVVTRLAGHGIGRALHEPPVVPHFGEPGRGPRLRAGMVFAIEPMLCAGRGHIRILGDGWTAVTVDGSLSSHFEHTVLVTDDGPEILTVAGV